MKLRSTVIGLVACIATAAASEPADPNADLADSVVHADRLVIRTGSLCHRARFVEVVIDEVSGEKEVAEIVSHFRLLPRQTTKIEDEETGEMVEVGWGNLMCCGDYVFEFFRSGRALTAFSLISLEFVRGDAISHGSDTAISEETNAFLKARFGLVDQPEWVYDKTLKKAVMVTPDGKKKANKAVDPTPGTAPLNSGGSSED